MVFYCVRAVLDGFLLRTAVGDGFLLRTGSFRWFLLGWPSILLRTGSFRWFFTLAAVGFYSVGHGLGLEVVYRRFSCGLGKR